MPLDRSRLPDPRTGFERHGVKFLGKGKWLTGNCVGHSGSDSFRANMETGAFSCMAGCGFRGGDIIAFEMQVTGMEFVDACKALGAWVENGKPSRYPEKPLPFKARDALEVIRFEMLLVAVAAGNLANGVPLADADRQRVLQAASRIEFIAQEVGR